MKKIALISSFCNTEKKIEILKENILILKNLGLDVLVISPISLPDEIRELSDFVFFTKENPLLLWPVRAFTFWKSIPTDKGFVMMHHNLADYGWAALYQVKKMSQIALTYDYDMFYHFIYDTDIDEQLQKEIIDNDVNFIHPRRNPNNYDEIWEATLHFMVFDRPTMQEIVSRIDLNTYLRSNGVAEGQALKWAQEIPLKISDYPLKDKVYYWENVDFFNHSINPDYKLFFNKNEYSQIWVDETMQESYVDENLRFFIYDVLKPQELKIQINDNTEKIYISKNELFVFEHSSMNIQKLIIEDENGILDLTDKIKSANRNLIYYNKIN